MVVNRRIVLGVLVIALSACAGNDDPDCTSENRCSFVNGRPTCVAGYVWEDPVSNYGCAYPNECLLLANEETRCALMGSGQQGSSCSSTTDCDGGHGCFAGDCRAICELGGVDCPFGYSCNGVAGWTRYGACAEN